MNLLENILSIINKYIKESDKRTAPYKTLLALKTDISKLVDTEMDSKVNKDIAYLCSICGKVSVNLQDKKYCRECFDKYID